ATILKLVRRRGSGCAGGVRWLIRRIRQRICLSDILVRLAINVLYIKGDDFLRLIVFENREVLGLEAADDISIPVPDRNIDQYEIGLHAKGVVGLLLCGQRRTQK